jgi:small subunit ribosomal protein S6
VNNYELVCIFNVKENHHAEGVDAVRSILSAQGATIIKEEDMGARTLAYEIQKENRGHYHLYNFEREGEMSKIEDLLKLQKGLIRHLFIKIEKPRKQRVRVRKTPALTTSPTEDKEPALEAE